MRVFMLILMVLSFVASAGLGGLASTNGFGEDATKAAEMVAEMEKSMGADSPIVKELNTVVSGYKTSSIGALATIALGLILVVVTFMKKDKGVLIMALAVIACVGAFIALSPAFEAGGKADARTQAMMYGIPGIIAALTALAANKFKKADV